MRDTWRVRSNRDRVRVASIAGVLACLALFAGLRVALIREHGALDLDRWVAQRLHSGEHDTPLAELVERIAAAPGSRKGAILLVIAVGTWGWLSRRDLRWGVLSAASFTGATSTVALVKLGLLDDLAGLDRAYLSEHATNVTAVLGMVLVMAALSHRRLWLLGATAAVAIVVVAMVAVAMMAGGHHFLTDVVGGIAIAGAWICGLTPVAYEMWRRPDLIHGLLLDGGAAVATDPRGGSGPGRPETGEPREGAVVPDGDAAAARRGLDARRPDA
jgi:membrane-associated phospholipid phosphatase